MPSFLDEYLVRLGASVDAGSFARLGVTLREAGSAFNTTALGMTSAALKAQLAIVGGFAAIGTAAVGLVDKIAMADQEYRLFALHMFMSKDAARGLKVAMDALGQPLENLTWDPELRGRTIQLLQDQRRMAPGQDFDMQMRRVRDIRFEFTRMEVELQYLTMNVVNNFLRALGTGPDELLKKLREFNTWVVTHMPEISQWIVKNLVPIGKEFGVAFRSVEQTLKSLAVTFTHVMGLLTDDPRMMGGFDLEEFLKALVRAITIATSVLTGFLVVVDDVIQGLSSLVDALAALAHGQFSDAGTALKTAARDLSMYGEAKDLVKAWQPAISAIAQDNAADGAPSAVSSTVDPDIWRRLAAGTGGVVSADTLKALAWVESGPLGMNARSKKGAIGTMQLMPDTAAEYEGDPNNMMDNLRMGTTHLYELMKHYGGNLPESIGAYNAGQGRMDQFLAGKATLPAESRNEIAKVLGLLGQRGSVQVGSVTITIIPPSGVSPEQIAHQVKAKLQDQDGKRVQRNMAEFQGWSYGQ